MRRMAAVGTTATLIHQSTAEDNDLVKVANTGAKTGYVGKNDQVTTTTGLPIAAGATGEVDCEAGEQLFAICAATESTTMIVL